MTDNDRELLRQADDEWFAKREDNLSELAKKADSEEVRKRIKKMASDVLRYNEHQYFDRDFDEDCDYNEK